MIVIGALTAGGLWLLGVPLALTLGLLAALLTFIPNLGPILAVVPAALLALLQSPTHALYVILLYLASRKLFSDAAYAKAHGFFAASFNDLRAGFAWRVGRRARACAGNAVYGSRICLGEDVIC
jgi:hypothetical protein